MFSITYKSLWYISLPHYLHQILVICFEFHDIFNFFKYIKLLMQILSIEMSSDIWAWNFDISCSWCQRLSGIVLIEFDQNEMNLWTIIEMLMILQYLERNKLCVWFCDGIGCIWTCYKWYLNLKSIGSIFICHHNNTLTVMNYNLLYHVVLIVIFCIIKLIQINKLWTWACKKILAKQYKTFSSL